MTIQLHPTFTVRLIAIENLIPHEHHDPQHAQALADKIQGEGIWKQPIFVVKNSCIILDGHHRLAAAQQLCLDVIPCICLDYDDRKIFVSSWREDFYVDRKVVRQAAKGNLLPIKTSRHHFNGIFPEQVFALEQLKSGIAA
ncbi:MAG: ParB N-terminal domain-containing protein [Pseudomonadales bacterium]|nr:ParB N-terminal domain-containing protein [Pseudomonadales bacterium]NRA18366.1 ParB N-terminal domain-containing protein [Oceanospirillaceae bacterium]